MRGEVYWLAKLFSRRGRRRGIGSMVGEWEILEKHGRGRRYMGERERNSDDDGRYIDGDRQTSSIMQYS